ncbi:LysR family transcriptional regulator [Atopomonas sediminilitoris]|uniref:LysR family transcriptional regulator n=1 Tax=Atopomonas sediminilitoris TaxID=2919919 RepID=UPI001F4E20BA|nr:LysR family transcriptional regulator [Atopomonas sediminilitoris]MCJ8168583.1 LysR family transcriptional regulator [Atopomonas sediminilitoris]
MRFSLRQIQVFVATGQHGSVSRAAETLAMSQSAASGALAELEKQFDCQLFDRQGKRLKLSSLGEEMLPKAAALLDQADEFEALLRGQAGFGELRVGATLTIGNYLATLLIGAFLQRHPQAHAQLHVHNTAHIIDQVRHFELDIGLIEGECSERDIHVTPWIEDELCVFCAPSHPLAKAKQVDMAQLAAQEWIMREAGSGTRRAFEAALRPHRQQLHVRLELEHTEAIKRAVESGLGIGCISRLALRDAFRRGSLVPLSTPALNLQRQFYFIWHKQKYQTAGMREFQALCLAMTQGLSSSSDIPLPSIA